MSRYLSLETERLILQPTVEEDATFIFDLMNTLKWLQYIGNRNITSIAKARNYITQRMKPQWEKLGFGGYTVIKKDDHIKIGTCGIYKRDGLDDHDIGFAFLPLFEKKGYAFEVGQKILELAFINFSLPQLAAITSIGNQSSQNLLRKLGFQYTKRITLPTDQEILYLFELSKLQYLKNYSGNDKQF